MATYSHSRCPEVTLWRMVLAQAMMDLYAGGMFDAEPARHFLTRPSKWFSQVCDMALLNPDAVRDRACVVMQARMERVPLRFIGDKEYARKHKGNRYDP